MRLMAFIEIEIMNSQMTFRIRSETRKAIQQIAKYREVSESDIVREAIREKVDSFFSDKSKTFNCNYPQERETPNAPQN